MTTDDTLVKCGKCKVVLTERSDIPPDERIACPKCGSTLRAFEVTAHGVISFKTKMGMKGKHPDRKKPFIEQVSGDDLFRDTGEWRKLDRVIDRDNDSYKEVITDPKTGKVIKKCEEALSKHIGHGNAKQKKDNPPK